MDRKFLFLMFRCGAVDHGKHKLDHIFAVAVAPCQIQGDMFRETAQLGGLDVQLVYYRGFGAPRSDL